MIAEPRCHGGNGALHTLEVGGPQAFLGTIDSRAASGAEQRVCDIAGDPDGWQGGQNGAYDLIDPFPDRRHGR